MREHGQDHDTRHPVMTADMIRQLPAGRALVIRGGHAPVIARLPMCWKDHLYRSARSTGQAIAALVPARDAAMVGETIPRPGFPPGDALEPVIPAGVINGGGLAAHYPWDDDVEPA